MFVNFDTRFGRTAQVPHVNLLFYSITENLGFHINFKCSMSTSFDSSLPFYSFYMRSDLVQTITVVEVALLVLLNHAMWLSLKLQRGYHLSLVFILGRKSISRLSMTSRLEKAAPLSSRLMEYCFENCRVYKMPGLLHGGRHQDRATQPLYTHEKSSQ